LKTLIVAFLFAVCLVIRGLIAPSTITPGTSTSITGTQAPQGTAGSSTISANSATIQSTCNGTVLTYGTASNQVNLIVCQDRTLAISTNEILDLYGHTTPLGDIFGSNCLFLHIKYIMIYLLPGTGDISGLTIGGAGANPWVGPMGGTTPTITIYPGGRPWELGEPTAGFVVGSTNGQLKVANNSASVAATYRLVIGGTTT
jgi:hypothetical protein